jgi:transposase
MSQHEHNTRLTPERRSHGGRREGAGRPIGKENHDPNTVDHTPLARQHRWDEHKSREHIEQQQHELANAKGRSWPYHECRLILTLVLGIMLHYGETPTQALRTASTIIHRSYKSLHALWQKWHDEGEVYVVDTATRGAGAATHADHDHHVSVDVIFSIIEYIRQANVDGGGCTTTNLLDHLLAQHGLRIHKSTLCRVLHHMGYFLY